MATISNQNIAEAIFQSSENKHGAELQKHLQNVVKFLSKRRLISRSEEILSKLKKINDNKHGILEVNVASAKKLHPDTRHALSAELKKRYKVHEVTISEKVDERLIGGFKVEANDEVIDLTIKNKLTKLEEHLTSI